MTFIDTFKNIFNSCQEYFRDSQYRSSLLKAELNYKIHRYEDLKLHPSQRRYFPVITTNKVHLDEPEFSDRMKRILHQSYDILPSSIQSILCASRTSFIFGGSSEDFLDHFLPSVTKFENENEKIVYEQLKSDCLDQLRENRAYNIIPDSLYKGAILVAHHQRDHLFPHDITDKELETETLETIANMLANYLGHIETSKQFIEAVIRDKLLDCNIRLLAEKDNPFAEPNTKVLSMKQSIETDPKRFEHENYSKIVTESKASFRRGFALYVQEIRHPNNLEFLEFQARHPNFLQTLENMMDHLDSVVKKVDARLERLIPSSAQLVNS